MSVTLRALLLVPPMAVGIDQARALALCGPDAQSCLEVAGRGWIGAAGAALVLVYAGALAVWLARVARGDRGGGAQPSSFRRLWAVATAGIALACGGQALVAELLGGSPAGLAGGWLELLPLCAAAGAAVAAVLRAAPAAARLVRSLPGRAPRPRLTAHSLLHRFAPPVTGVALGHGPLRRGRAPPAAV